MRWLRWKLNSPKFKKRTFKTQATGQTATALSVPSVPQRLEVRREAVAGSGEKAARRDLESKTPLGDRSHYQNGLHAAHSEAVSNRIEQAVADIGVVDEELADL